MDETIIIQFLQGKLSAEERKKFFAWLESDIQQMELYKSVKQAWSLTSGLYEKNELNPELEYKIFHYRNFTLSGYSKKIKTSPFLTFIKYAAVFVLAFGLSFLAFYVIFPKSKVPTPEFTEIFTRAGEKSQITLPDGSKIWVNACTKLKYPNDLSQKQIELYLEGEAFFDMKKIPNRKIIVHTSQINIKVLGTAFNLKSYSDDNIIETTLVRGEIAIEKRAGSGEPGNQILLKPNQSATFFKNTRKITLNKLIETRIEQVDDPGELELIAEKKLSNLVVINKMDPINQTSWKDGKLNFKRESFENLIKVMERWFNKDITIKDQSLKKVRFSGTFDKETVEQALEALSLPVPFKFQINKDSIFIYR